VRTVITRLACDSSCSTEFVDAISFDFRAQAFGEGEYIVTRDVREERSKLEGNKGGETETAGPRR
jgi:hypothetical protein